MLSRFSHVQLLANLWTVAHQAPLSMGFSSQEYWSSLPFPSPGDLPDPGIRPMSLRSPELAGGFLTTSTTWKAQTLILFYILWASLVTQMVKNLPVMQKPQETQVRSLVWEDPLEEEMVTHSSILAWRIPWTGEPGGLQSMGSQRVGHKWLSMHSMRQPDRVQEGGLTLDWWWEEEEEKGKQSLLEQHWKQWVCLFQGGYLSKASVVAKRLTKRKDEKRSTSRSDSGKVMVISQ